MATTVHDPPKIEEQRDPSRLNDSGNGGRRNLVPAGGDFRAGKTTLRRHLRPESGWCWRPSR